MPRLDEKNLAALEAMRPSVPRQRPPYSPGVWEGGRIYVDDEGTEYFLPIGAARKSLKKKRLTFIGDGQRNVIGYGDVRLTNEVQP